MAKCEICGNHIGVESKVCRFCGHRSIQDDVAGKHGPTHRVVNIERNKPTVAQALKQLDHELERARVEKIPVLTVIHGYGSSGKGGAIRRECRKTFDYLSDKKKIWGYILGENFAKKNGATRDLLRRCPDLRDDHNLNRGNKGVTLIIL